MPKAPLDQLPELAQNICNYLNNIHWKKLRRLVSEDQRLESTIPGFLLQPSEIIVYIGQFHLGIEYVGNENLQEFLSPHPDFAVRLFDLSDAGEDFLNKIIGIDYVGVGKFPLFDVVEDLVMPTNEAVDELVRHGWNWDAQNFISPINTSGPIAVSGRFTRIVNGRFFGTNGADLVTRHIKWLDLLPVEVQQLDGETETLRISGGELQKRIGADVQARTFTSEENYRYKHLPRINRFVELIGNTETTEREITSLLASDEYSFIIKMRFSSKSVIAEVDCEWQSQDKQSIRLDFLIEGTSGYADILEFKLPFLKGSAMVGSTNRERLSAEISSCVAQTRVYSEYFEDPNNREWVESHYGIRIRYPRRLIIVGRRWDFASDEWRAVVNEYPSLQIMSYDDLIDGVVMQFYQ